MGEDGKWERKNFNLPLFKDLLAKWIKDGSRKFRDSLSEEQIGSFIKQYEHALSMASNGNTQHIKDLYFEALRVRQNFSVAEARRDPVAGVLIWLSDEQMSEWKELLCQQGILVLN